MSKYIKLSPCRNCGACNVYAKCDICNLDRRADVVHLITQQAEEIERLKRIIDPHVDEDGNFDKEGFDWKCLRWESEIERLVKIIKSVHKAKILLMALDGNTGPGHEGEMKAINNLWNKVKQVYKDYPQNGVTDDF